MRKTTVLPERRHIFDKAVREKTYGRMRMALYQLAPSLVVQSTVLNGRLMGCYDAQLEAITIDRSMTMDDKKCALIHELGHWVFDDDSQPPYGAKRERATRELTASTLIRADDYRQAELAYEGDMFLMANDLGVNPDIILDYQKYVIPTLIRTKRGELSCLTSSLS